MPSIVSNVVVRPLVVIFLMQSVITMAIYAIPVIVPVAAIDLGLTPESVGFLVTLIYLFSTVTGLFSQALIVHFGPTRLFQLLLFLTAVSVLILLGSSTLMAIISVAILGIATGPMNPLGSFILAKVVAPDRRAFVFSIKQCATPAGGMLAGILLPTMMLTFGWQAAMATIPALVVVMMALAPLGQLGQPQVTQSQPAFNLRKTLASLSIVTVRGPIRDLTLASTCLAAAQMALATYLVVYLWRNVGLSEALAGLVFAVLHLSGIVSRLFLGLLADRFTSAKWILVAICLVLSLSLFLIGQFEQHWWIGFVYVVVAVAGATGNGWVGLYYAELARLSPPDRIAEFTGASQFFTYIGLLSGPMIFGGLLAFVANYETVLNIFAIWLIVTGLFLARSDMSRPAISSQ